MVNTNKILSDSTYEIKGEIGSGGAGVVYKAWHKRLEKNVIIKELKNTTSGDKVHRNEIEALKNVKSKYLPQIYDYIEEDGKVYTVMEYIEGDSFDKLLKNGEKFSQVRVIKWFKQLANALEEIHKLNIYHRDIKPANIMLTSNDDICLIDFNAALVDGNNIKIISRSLGYASPEQYSIFEHYMKTNSQVGNGYTNSAVGSEATFSAETEIVTDEELEVVESSIARQTFSATAMYYSDKDIDWKVSDIYSLGATIYHLLTGIKPSINTNEIKPISELKNYSDSIAYIIDKTMEHDPEDRFQNVTTLISILNDINKLNRNRNEEKMIIMKTM